MSTFDGTSSGGKPYKQQWLVWPNVWIDDVFVKEMILDLVPKDTYSDEKMLELVPSVRQQMLYLRQCTEMEWKTLGSVFTAGSEVYDMDRVADFLGQLAFVLIRKGAFFCRNCEAFGHDTSFCYRTGPPESAIASVPGGK